MRSEPMAVSDPYMYTWLDFAIDWTCRDQLIVSAPLRWLKKQLLKTAFLCNICQMDFYWSKLFAFRLKPANWKPSWALLPWEVGFQKATPSFYFWQRRHFCEKQIMTGGHKSTKTFFRTVWRRRAFGSNELSPNFATSDKRKDTKVVRIANDKVQGLYPWPLESNNLELYKRKKTSKLVQVGYDKFLRLSKIDLWDNKGLDCLIHVQYRTDRVLLSR